MRDRGTIGDAARMWNKYIGEVDKFDRVVIYGAGQIGRKVLGILEKADMRDKVICFAVSDVQNAPDKVNDICVKSIDEISQEYEEALFLLAVSDRFLYELEQMVIRKKINHYFDGKKIYQVFCQGDVEQKHIEIDVREVFLQQYKNGSFNRLDIVVRYLAIEDYHGINNYGFNLYRKMQSQRISEDYVEKAVETFRELIASWELNGYNRESEIECDKNLHLIDGSHRIAMGLYYRLDKILCKVNPYVDDIEYGAEWFIEHGFDVEEIRLINGKFEELYRMVCKPISCVLWPAVYEYYDEITDKLGLLYEIKSVKDYQFKEETFEKAVRGIYYIDDIESWKIEKKIEYLKLFASKTIRMIELDIPKPEFRLESANGHTILIDSEGIKRIFRNCYKKYVDNYFYDIIMHTGDNYEQSEYILNLFKQEFSLRDYFKEIRPYRWIAIKTDTPAMPDDFPETYPFSKDIDIICVDEDYETIIDRTVEFLNKATGKMRKVNVIAERNRTKIRVEQNGFLIVQFDIARLLIHMDKEFVECSIRERECINGCFVAKQEHELIYRVYDFLISPQKVWHLTYLKKNKNIWNIDLAIKAIPCLRDKIIQVWRSI